MASKSKLYKFIKWRIKVAISQTRTMVGTFMAFDRHMNIVLADCDEYRKVITKSGEEREFKKVLGLVIIRGENILSVTVDAPPLPKPKVPVFGTKPGAALAIPGARIPAAVPQTGLSGPAMAMIPGMVAPPPPPPGIQGIPPPHLVPPPAPPGMMPQPLHTQPPPPPPPTR